MPEKTDPIMIEAAGMLMTVDYRQGVGGDEGLTFDITVAGAEEAEKGSSASTVLKRHPIITLARPGNIPCTT